MTLDVEMPEMDGLQALAEIRKTHPRLPIIMFSTLTERGGRATLEALSPWCHRLRYKPANVGSVALAQQRFATTHPQAQSALPQGLERVARCARGRRW